jgi:hypothetical protein
MCSIVPFVPWSSFRTEMVKKRAREPFADKRRSKKPSESLEMFDSLFRENLEMEPGQAGRDKSARDKVELSESNEMFDAVFREDLGAEEKNEKEGSPAKKKRVKPKPSELPPWKRRAEEKEKAGEKRKKGRPKNKSRARGKVSLLLLFLVLLGGTGLHYYGFVDLGPYAERLKALKAEAVWLYEAYAGKGKGPAEIEESSAITKPIPTRPQSQPVVTAAKEKAPLKPKASVEKARPAPRTLAGVSDKRGPAAASPAASAVAVKSAAKDTRPAVSPVTAGRPASFPYSVYLGSYSKTKYLQKAMREYEDKGLLPFWVKVDLGKKGVWHRVFAGCFRTGKEAEAFIKEKGIPEGEARQVKYGNLIGTYRSEKALQTKRAALLKLGYSPYIISRHKDEYLLFVGAFSSQSNAEDLRGDLSSKGIRSRIVVR